MQDFRKLIVWKKAQDLTVYAYNATRRFPSSEQFGLTAQIRSASCSIGANIAVKDVGGAPVRIFCVFFLLLSVLHLKLKTTFYWLKELGIWMSNRLPL